MSLHNEDRELQIRLAELQADVQIYLTTCFALLAGAFAGIIGLEQIYFSLPPEKVLVKYSVLTSIILLSVGIWVFVRFFLRKALASRKQMEELRKQYVWQEQTFVQASKLGNIKMRMERDRDIVLAYYAHISKSANTAIGLSTSLIIGWLAFLYVCFQNEAFKSSALGFIVGFTLSVLFVFMLTTMYIDSFLLHLVELDLGITNYVDNLTFATWNRWFNQRRKKLLYLGVGDIVGISILIGFYLISSWYIFGLTLFIPLLIFVGVIIIGSIANLKKAIKEKPEIFSKFKK